MDADTRAAILAAWERRPETRPEGLLFQFNDWRFTYWGKTWLISSTAAEALARDGFVTWLLRSNIVAHIRPPDADGNVTVQLTGKGHPVCRSYSGPSLTIALARAVYAEGE